MRVDEAAEEGDVELDRFEAEAGTVDVVARVRALVADELRRLDRIDLTDDAELVASELATNALLHGDGIVRVAVDEVDEGVRVEVEDRTRVPPILALATADSMTGRGLRLVSSIASRWGVDPADGGKVVWAELESGHVPESPSAEALLDLWDDELGDDLVEATPSRFRVSLGDVPTDLLLAAKTHVDNLVREFVLLTAGAEGGRSSPVPPHLAGLIESVVNRFAEARQSIKRQAVAAATRGDDHVRLELHLGLDAAGAGEEYLAALDEADAYCRAARLLTLETPPQHRVFRRWYVGELVAQLRAAAEGLPVPPPAPFEQRLLQEIDVVARASERAERAARLYDVAAALSGAAGPADVAAAVLGSGVPALGASAGALLLRHGTGLRVAGSVGYSDDLVHRFAVQSVEAQMPAATALRTGDPVWLESKQELDERFPELRDVEVDAVSVCALPLVAGGRRLGVLRFSFEVARLFDEEERRFALALAAQAAQALDRAQLEEQRATLSRRLQRGLLPGRLPAVPGVEVAAASHPAGNGAELGGAFYDVWPTDGGHWAFAMGDAAGSGPEAAALSALVRFSLRALTVDDGDPVEVLRRLNRVMLGSPSDELGAERFCTLLVGLLVPGHQVEVRLSSAGHPSPLLRRRSGPVELVPVGGTVLGVVPEPEVGSARVALDPGDTLLVVTDGAVQARAQGRPFGIEGVRAAVATAPDSARGTADALVAAVRDHVTDELDDDVAALALRVTGSTT
jgi:serine phosphatase RsbU (regulator of sigma subunit)